MSSDHSLLKLDLQCNGIGDKGAVAIVKAVQDFPEEFQLFLYNVSITAKGAKQVLEHRQTTQIKEDTPELAWNVVMTETSVAVQKAFGCFNICKL